MRIAIFTTLLLSPIALAQDEAPNATEEKAIAAVEKYLRGKASIDPSLSEEARVAVKLETVTDASLATLAKYPVIGSIQAFESRASTRGFTGLKKLPHLRRLILNKSNVTDKNLAAIVAECKELRELTIPQSKLTNDGLASLKKLPRLVSLNIAENPKISDKGLATIQKLERLEILRLAKTSITDKGLLELQPLEGLRALNVEGTKVTQAAADQFPNLMPNLRVVRR